MIWQLSKKIIQNRLRETQYQASSVERMTKSVLSLYPQST